MLAAPGTMWAGAWLFASAPADTFSLTSLTAVAAVALLTAVALVVRAARLGGAVGVAAVPVPVRLRATVHRAGPPRLCDPDAAGRPRPRAPSSDRAA